MKIEKLTLGIFLILFFQSFVGFSQPNNNDPVIVWLKGFYVTYMTEISKMPPDIKKIESLRANNCTKQFLSKLNSGDYDFDPFISAQDFDIKSIKSLSIRKGSRNNLYVISYKNTGNNHTVNVNVFIAHEKNRYLIMELK
jgi:hypothetical protein